MIYQKEFSLPANSKGCHLITHLIEEHIPSSIENGLLHLFIKHSSAGLTINENADPSVRTDMDVFLDDLVPGDFPKFTHTYEGFDDMPAHIKSSLFGAGLTIPLTNGRMNLGTWQGIYLCEFRYHGGSRKMVLTIQY